MEDAIVSSNRSRTTEESFAPLGPKVAESLFYALPSNLMASRPGSGVEWRLSPHRYLRWREFARYANHGFAR